MEQAMDNTRSYIPISAGTMISHYKIVEKIGAGGMGEVYLAEDTKLGRKVAMKFLPSHLVSEEDIKARFVREAQTLAKLNHPNIVSVYDVSEFNGRPYYVMEMVEGESLNNISSDKPLSFDLIVEYALQICQGLGEAHRAGIIHRDIKPANIIVDEKGRIRLLDFGLAAVAGDAGLTRTGTTLGTVSYMSPEQVSGREIDHRSDLFSLGIVIYELIAGRSPFKRDNEGATLKAIMEENLQPLARYRSDVPEKLQQIVSELLEKDKELRTQSAEGVIAALKRLLYDSTQSGFSRVPVEKAGKRKPVAGIVAFAVIVLAAASYFIFEKSAKKKAFHRKNAHDRGVAV
jgi:serine/threonine protein kinase